MNLLLATYVWPAVATPQRTLLLASFFGSTLLHGLRSAPDGGIFGGPACLELVVGVERVTAAAPLGLQCRCTPAAPPPFPRPLTRPALPMLSHTVYNHRLHLAGLCGVPCVALLGRTRWPGFARRPWG